MNSHIDFAEEGPATFLTRLFFLCVAVYTEIK